MAAAEARDEVLDVGLGRFGQGQVERLGRVGLKEGIVNVGEVVCVDG